MRRGPSAIFHIADTLEQPPANERDFYMQTMSVSQRFSEASAAFCGRAGCSPPLCSRLKATQTCIASHRESLVVDKKNNVRRSVTVCCSAWPWTVLVLRGNYCEKCAPAQVRLRACRRMC